MSSDVGNDRKVAEISLPVRIDFTSASGCARKCVRDFYRRQRRSLEARSF